MFLAEQQRCQALAHAAQAAEDKERAEKETRKAVSNVKFWGKHSQDLAKKLEALRERIADVEVLHDSHTAAAFQKGFGPCKQL